MEVLLEREGVGRAVPAAGPVTDAAAEAAARRALRRQVSKLEREVADAVCAAFPEVLELAPAPRARAGVLQVGELEALRDHLVDRLADARRQLAGFGRSQEEARARLERMLLDPAAYRGCRISQRELGEPGCGVWRVAPRLGIIGRMMGWWQVKLSSGCPLAT